MPPANGFSLRCVGLSTRIVHATVGPVPQALLGVTNRVLLRLLSKILDRHRRELFYNRGQATPAHRQGQGIGAGLQGVHGSSGRVSIGGLLVDHEVGVRAAPQEADAITGRIFNLIFADKLLQVFLFIQPQPFAQAIAVFFDTFQGNPLHSGGFPGRQI